MPQYLLFDGSIMPSRSLPQLTNDQERGRFDRIESIARRFGFVGRIEYRHVFSQSGGAQYLQSSQASEDVLVIYAEAFERDADPEDYSLEAMIAHERGHQLLARHPRLSSRMLRMPPLCEEVLASIAGGIIADDQEDRDTLLSKALGDLIIGRIADHVAIRLVMELKDLLEKLL